MGEYGVPNKGSSRTFHGPVPHKLQPMQSGWGPGLGVLPYIERLTVPSWPGVVYVRDALKPLEPPLQVVNHLLYIRPPPLMLLGGGHRWACFATIAPIRPRPMTWMVLHIAFTAASTVSGSLNATGPRAGDAPGRDVPQCHP